MTLLEQAQKAIAAINEDRSASNAQILADLKILRDDIEDRIWDIKLATGIGLWKPSEDK